MSTCIGRSLASLGAVTTLCLGAGAAVAGQCVTKAGSATGLTRDFAEYESLLIIKQVTGNWPFEQDRIERPTYTCKQDGAFWTCRAVAKVCKS
jgi:hypothetical protein